MNEEISLWKHRSILLAYFISYWNRLWLPMQFLATLYCILVVLVFITCRKFNQLIFLFKIKSLLFGQFIFVTQNLMSPSCDQLIFSTWNYTSNLSFRKFICASVNESIWVANGLHLFCKFQCEILYHPLNPNLMQAGYWFCLLAPLIIRGLFIATSLRQDWTKI